MKSLTKLFRYGPGPSSSHTIAPSIAARSFLKLLSPYKEGEVVVTLHGSLALTGTGHGTEKAIGDILKDHKVTFVRNIDPLDPSRPNSFEMELRNNDKEILKRHYASIGGGELVSDDDLTVNEKDIYPFVDLESVKSYMNKNKITSPVAFCGDFEEPSIESILEERLKEMFVSLETGLSKTGPIPANKNPRLQLKRTAGAIYQKAQAIKDEDSRREMLISAYAYAVSESNACSENIVTAPTCGSAGVIPSLLYYEYHDLHKPFDLVAKSLFAAGLFGNIVKQNASIAGAIGGCQAEIGTASSMGAAALCFIDGLSFHQEEYAAECSMEHFLGLSCDPIDGYVIIPCIERNGMGALRAYDSFLYAKYIAPLRRNEVSFDNVVEAMKLTGDSLSKAYKETAEGGLAEILNSKNND